MKYRALLPLACLAMAPAAASTAQTTQESATRARDVNGIALGMTIEQVRGRMVLEHTAFETFEGSSAGIDYALGFTPAGRVFRIQSTQLLGRFQPDAEFTASLSAKLSQKYGPPAYSSLPTGPAHWGLVQNVGDASGTIRPFTVMWADAMLQEQDNGVALLMTLLDWRILWEDQDLRNLGPLQDAGKKIRL